MIWTLKNNLLDRVFYVAYAVMDDEHERKGQERGGLEVMVGVVVVLMALTESSTSQGADQVQTMVMLAIMCV